MERVVDVASFVCVQFRQRFCRRIDEMKLHKLLYFVQRKSIAETGEPMFNATFHAWKYGPVLLMIRQMYKNGDLESHVPDLQNKSEEIILSVMTELAGSDSMLLSSISHGDVSWQKAHKRALESGGEDDVMMLEDIRIDALRYKQRCELLKAWREYKQSMNI